jgi:hypothetical protein
MSITVFAGCLSAPAPMSLDDEGDGVVASHFSWTGRDLGTAGVRWTAEFPVRGKCNFTARLVGVRTDKVPPEMRALFVDDAGHHFGGPHIDDGGAGIRTSDIDTTSDAVRPYDVTTSSIVPNTVWGTVSFYLAPPGSTLVELLIDCDQAFLSPAVSLARNATVFTQQSIESGSTVYVGQIAAATSGTVFEIESGGNDTQLVFWNSATESRVHLRHPLGVQRFDGIRTPVRFKGGPGPYSLEVEFKQAPFVTLLGSIGSYEPTELDCASHGNTLDCVHTMRSQTAMNQSAPK